MSKIRWNQLSPHQIDKLIGFLEKISRIEEPSRRVCLQVIDDAKELLKEIGE